MAINKLRLRVLRLPTVPWMIGISERLFAISLGTSFGVLYASMNKIAEEQPHCDALWAMAVRFRGNLKRRSATGPAPPGKLRRTPMRFRRIAVAAELCLRTVRLVDGWYLSHWHTLLRLTYSVPWRQQRDVQRLTCGYDPDPQWSIRSLFVIHSIIFGPAGCF